MPNEDLKMKLWDMPIVNGHNLMQLIGSTGIEKLVDFITEYTTEAEDKILDEKMNQISKMISEYIRSTWPGGDVLRASERGPIDYDPLVRQIRDFAHDNQMGGRILNRAINKADEIIKRLENN